jgi:hypothetical protein
MSMSMPRSLKVQGHKLVITEKIESLSHRSPASYCAVCECGETQAQRPPRGCHPSR